MMQSVGPSSVVGSLLLACLLFLVPPCGGQDAEPEAGAKDGKASVRFLVLEEVERNEKLARIHRGLLAERVAREQRRREFADLATRTSGIRNLTDDDQKLLACLRIRRDMQALRKKLQEDRANRLSIRDAIRKAVREEAEDEKALEILRTNSRQLDELLQQTLAREKRLTRHNAAVLAFLRRIPPPKEFTSSTGLRMVYIPRADNPFYVSDKPVPQALFDRLLDAAAARESDPRSPIPHFGVTRNEAAVFCRRLSRLEGYAYSLPRTDQANALRRKVVATKVAVWLDEPWKWTDPEEQNMAQRFATPMGTVWDPGKLLADRELTPELPFASHRKLAVILVTAQETGRAVRMKRLKAQLD